MMANANVPQDLVVMIVVLNLKHVLKTVVVMVIVIKLQEYVVVQMDTPVMIVVHVVKIIIPPQ